VDEPLRTALRGLLMGLELTLPLFIVWGQARLGERRVGERA
jgi:hypothetical protein